MNYFKGAFAYDTKKHKDTSEHQGRDRASFVVDPFVDFWPKNTAGTLSEVLCTCWKCRAVVCHRLEVEDVLLQGWLCWLHPNVLALACSEDYSCGPRSFLSLCFQDHTQQIQKARIFWIAGWPHDHLRLWFVVFGNIHLQHKACLCFHPSSKRDMRTD